jgi:cobalamin synthase
VAMKNTTNTNILALLVDVLFRLSLSVATVLLNCELDSVQTRTQHKEEIRRKFVCLNIAVLSSIATLRFKALSRSKNQTQATLQIISIVTVCSASDAHRELQYQTGDRVGKVLVISIYLVYLSITYICAGLKGRCLNKRNPLTDLPPFLT